MKRWNEMTFTKMWAIIAIIATVAFGQYWVNVQTTHAQNPSLTPFQVIAGGAHTLCNISTGEYCLATDGLWFSSNGTSWAQIGASAASVTVVATLPLVASQTGNTITITCPTCVTPANLKATFDTAGVTATIPAQTVSVQ